MTSNNSTITISKQDFLNNKPIYLEIPYNHSYGSIAINQKLDPIALSMFIQNCEHIDQINKDLLQNFIIRKFNTSFNFDDANICLSREQALKTIIQFYPTVNIDNDLKLNELVPWFLSEEFKVLEKKILEIFPKKTIDLIKAMIVNTLFYFTLTPPKNILGLGNHLETAISFSTTHTFINQFPLSENLTKKFAQHQQQQNKTFDELKNTFAHKMFFEALLLVFSYLDSNNVCVSTLETLNENIYEELHSVLHRQLYSDGEIIIDFSTDKAYEPLNINVEKELLNSLVSSKKSLTPQSFSNSFKTISIYKDFSHTLQTPFKSMGGIFKFLETLINEILHVFELKPISFEKVSFKKGEISHFHGVNGFVQTMVKIFEKERGLACFNYVSFWGAVINYNNKKIKEQKKQKQVDEEWIKRGFKDFFSEAHFKVWLKKPEIQNFVQNFIKTSLEQFPTLEERQKTMDWAGNRSYSSLRHAKLESIRLIDNEADLVHAGKLQHNCLGSQRHCEVNALFFEFVFKDLHQNTILWHCCMRWEGIFKNKDGSIEEGWRLSDNKGYKNNLVVPFDKFIVDTFDQSKTTIN